MAELKFTKVKKRDIEFEYAYREYGRSQYSGEMLYEVIIRISSKIVMGLLKSRLI